MSVLPPNPSLVAIILIIKTREGVKHVYHYPPNPGKDKPHAKLEHERSSEEDSYLSSDDDSISSLKGDVSEDEASRFCTNGDHFDESSSASPEKHHDAAWRKRMDGSAKELLGLPAGFEQAFCPHPSFQKKRFEMGIDKLTFLGWPVFASEDGEWKRKKRSSSGQNMIRRMSTISEQPVDSTSRQTSVQLDEALGETTGNESLGEEPESGVSKTSQTLETLQEEREEAPRKLSAGHGLIMFHVVFVLNPPPLEYHIRMDEMYKHVVKKFSRALKWEQARSNFVHRECEKLRAMKARKGASKSPSTFVLVAVADQIQTQPLIRSCSHQPSRVPSPPSTNPYLHHA